MLGEAFDFPTSGSRGPRSVLVGGLLVLLSVALVNGPLAFVDPNAPLRPQAPLLGVVALAVVPVVLLRGYHLRVFREVTTRADPEAPGFGGVLSLVGDGLRSVFVAVIYALPVAVFGGLAAAGQFTARLNLAPATEAVLRNVAGVSLVLALFAVLAMAYLLPAALANLAYHDTVWAAFHLRRLVSGTLTEDYVVGWVGVVLLQAITFPIAFALRVLVVGFFLQFLVAVAVRYVWARAAADGLGLEPMAEPTPEPTVDEPIPAVRRVEPTPAIRRVDFESEQPTPAIRRVDRSSDDATPAIRRVEAASEIPTPTPAIRRVESPADEPTPAIRRVEPTPAIRRAEPTPAIRRVTAEADGTGRADVPDSEEEAADSEEDSTEPEDDDAEKSPPETTIDEWSFGEDRA